MAKNYFFILLIFWGFSSCDLRSPNDESDHAKVGKIDRQRCSFDLSADLYLKKIDASFDEEGYFKIASYKSNNMIQLFIYNSSINVHEKLDAEVQALNAPGVFTAKSIDSTYHFGGYQGKGVIMKGTYEGGIITGTIKIFCFGTGEKGFIAIRQTITSKDTHNFDLVENSFHLK